MSKGQEISILLIIIFRVCLSLAYKLRPIAIFLFMFVVFTYIVSLSGGEVFVFFPAFLASMTVYLAMVLVLSIVLTIYFFFRRRPMFDKNSDYDKRILTAKITDQLGLKW